MQKPRKKNKKHSCYKRNPGKAKFSHKYSHLREIYVTQSFTQSTRLDMLPDILYLNGKVPLIQKLNEELFCRAVILVLEKEQIFLAIFVEMNRRKNI